VLLTAQTDQVTVSQGEAMRNVGRALGSPSADVDVGGSRLPSVEYWKHYLLTIICRPIICRYLVDLAPER
jgi:hypothetical protein